MIPEMLSGYNRVVSNHSDIYYNNTYQIFDEINYFVIEFEIKYDSNSSYMVFITSGAMNDTSFYLLTQYKPNDHLMFMYIIDVPYLGLITGLTNVIFDISFKSSSIFYNGYYKYKAFIIPHYHAYSLEIIIECWY